MLIAPVPSTLTMPECRPPLRRPAPREVIQEALAELPDMPWRIARHLVERDYVGRRRAPMHCPLSHFITTALFRAGYDTAHVKVRARYARGLGAKVALPWGARAFIREFDRGWYPELVGGP